MSNSKPRTFVITGATGLVGSELAKALLDRGDVLVLLVRGEDVGTAREHVRTRLSLDDDDMQNVRVVVGDLLSVRTKYEQGDFDDSFSDCPQVAGLIHLAADLSFRSRDREAVFDTNRKGTEQVMWLAKTLDIPLYHVSTAYVHGRRKGVLKEQELLQAQFNNPYEESKFVTEELLQEEVTHGLKCAIIRPSIVIRRNIPENKKTAPFGYYSIVGAVSALKIKLSHLLTKHHWLSAILGIKVEDGGVLRARLVPFFVADSTLNLVRLPALVETMMAILDEGTDQPNGIVYHVVDPNPLTMKKISAIALEEVGLHMPVVVVPHFITQFFFAAVRVASHVIPVLVDLSKKFHYYGYYMTATYEFDITNTVKLMGKERYTTLFEDQEDYLHNATRQFLSK